MSEYFRISREGSPVSYVEADSKPEARRLWLADLTIDRMAGSEVASLIESGQKVIRAAAAGSAPHTGE